MKKHNLTDVTEEELMLLICEETNEIRARADLEPPIVLDSVSGLLLVANLQLALRHPGNTGNTATFARTLINGIQGMFRERGYAAYVELIKRGENPAPDWTWKKRGGA